MVHLPSSAAMCPSLLIGKGKEGIFFLKKEVCPLPWPKYQRDPPELLANSEFFLPLPGTVRMRYKKMSGEPAWES